MKVKRVIDLTYHLYPERGQRRLRLIATRTMESSYSNEYALEMHAHIGTHVEGPCHCIGNGKTIDELPPDEFVGEAAVVDLKQKSADNRTITRNDLLRKGQHIEKGDIVLLKTGYGKRFSTEEMQSEAYM